MKRISLDLLKEGLIVGKPIESAEGEVLFKGGHCLKHEDIVSLSKKNINGVWIKEPQDLTAYEMLSEANQRNVDAMIQAVFRFNSESRHPLMHYMLAYRREELARELQMRGKI